MSQNEQPAEWSGANRTGAASQVPPSDSAPQPPTHHGTAPALRQPRWSGKKTAVVAALAIGLSSAGAIGAAAATPAGESGGAQGQHTKGGFGGPGTPGGTGTRGRTGNQNRPGGVGGPGTQGGTGSQGGTPGRGTTGGGTTTT